MRIPPARQSRPLRHALLVLLAQLARPVVAAGRPPDPNGRVLLIRPDHLGDILFTTPALRLLRERCPDAAITYLAGPWAAPVVERNPHVDEVLYCEFSWFSGRRRRTIWEPYAVLIDWARRLRRRRFAAAVNLRFDFWWGAALAYLAGIPCRVGYGTPDCRPFLNVAVPYGAGRHEVVQNTTLVAELCKCLLPSRTRADDSGTVGGLEFPVRPEERAFADRYLASSGLSAERPLVVIHPGTRAAIKCWTEDGFGEVATALSKRLGARVVITGSAAERPLALGIAKHSAAPVHIAAGDTTIGQLAALFERAAIVIGVDSGPLHLAVALGRPTVHLFGPSDHVSFGPYGRGRHAVVRAGLSCSPCRRLDWDVSELPAHDCMAAITVEQVLRASERVLMECSDDEW